MNGRIAAKVVAASVLGLGLFSSAGSGTYQFKQPSPKEQLKLGGQAAQEIRNKEKILPATDFRVRALRRVAQKLLNTLPADEPWQFSFDVIESKEINAFALPGGPVFFFTGILEKLKTEDELAGVLAHEMTHVRREHWARQYRDAQNRNIWLSAGLLVFGANRDVSQFAGLLNSLVDLKYSRGHETQSDDDGLRIMIDAGYNPAGMANVFRMLASQGGAKPPEFASSHPSDKNRVKRIEEKSAKFGRSYPPLKPISLSPSAGAG